MNLAVVIVLTTLGVDIAFSAISLLSPSRHVLVESILSALSLIGIWGIIRKLSWARVFNSALIGVQSMFLMIAEVVLAWTTGFSLATIIVAPVLVLSVSAFVLSVTIKAYRTHFSRKEIM